MRLHPADFLKRLPLPATDRWPDGVCDIEALDRAGLTLEMFAPRGVDHQTAHAQDEIYIVISGNATLETDGVEYDCAPGDALFVPARAVHQFVRISDGFATWAIFWGEGKP